MEFYNRDLSWLSFNYRVLMEALDKQVPLIERLRFLAIYSSNLDEFFRVRVAEIRSLATIDKKKINKKIDFDPSTLLDQIHEETGRQLELYGKTLKEVVNELKHESIFICSALEEIPTEAKTKILHYFKTKVAAYLKPVTFSNGDQLFLDNQALYFAVAFKSGKQSLIKIPSDKLPRFFKTYIENTNYFIFLDDIIRLHTDLIFPGEEVFDCSSIKLNKDADLRIDDEYEGDLVKKIEKQIQKRNLGVPSRFLFDGNISDDLLAVLIEVLNLEEDDVVRGGRYHNLNDLFQISPEIAGLEYERMAPVRNLEVDESRSIFQLIEKKELLFHFPYHSYDYVLQFFNEASLDPEVEEINATFYRMAKNSIIGEALISAATKGKKVKVFMEVKARFDEENNLFWARRMKEAGITIVYSLPGLKVHAKVALVKKKDRMYGFFGTGNLNEKTSEIYCDHGLLSANVEMTKELSSVFEYLYIKREPPRFKHLIVSQFNAMDRFTGMIEREIEHAKAGKEARIIVKLNNLQEPQLIRKLYEAAESGVDVRIIVRSICCLVPEEKGIKVKRIVDRYLEHARIFYFHDNGAQNIFLGSSDWMNRNLHRRIEVSFPVYDEKMRQELLTILRFQWEDDLKGVWLNKKMENIRADPARNIRAQVEIYNYLKNQ
ncbi:MAG: polyphosphate kinase 1 [Cyclobacteriaceae bacterium]